MLELAQQGGLQAAEERLAAVQDAEARLEELRQRAALYKVGLAQARRRQQQPQDTR